jgi:beta-barrel assembly-enhancing protease
VRSLLKSAAMALAAAAAPLSAAQTDYTLPPYTPAYEPRTVDERGAWMQADEYERAMQQSPLLVTDEGLKAYVRRVLCETVGHDRCDSVRIYVLESPHFNASMMANGVMAVNTGLLLRVRSEAELGSVLGHEFAHFEMRHILEDFKNRRGASDALAWVAMLGGISGTDTSSSQMLLLGSIYSFSRTQETQADLLGFKYLAASSYPSTASAEVWANLMAEQDATATGRKRKARHSYNAGFSDSHPTDLKRAAYLAKAAREVGDTGDDPRVTGHYEAMRPMLPRLLHSQVRMHDFGGTEYILGSIARMTGWTGELLFARGEMYQLRGNPRDFVTASQFYRQAIAQGFAPPVAHRNLGISLLKAGAASEAQPELATYLQLAPDATDASVIKALIAK